MIGLLNAYKNILSNFKNLKSQINQLNEQNDENKKLLERNDELNITVAVSIIKSDRMILNFMI